MYLRSYENEKDDEKVHCSNAQKKDVRYGKSDPQLLRGVGGLRCCSNCSRRVCWQGEGEVHRFSLPIERPIVESTAIARLSSQLELNLDIIFLRIWHYHTYNQCGSFSVTGEANIGNRDGWV